MTLQAVVLIGLICIVECDQRPLCETPQYVELGGKGILECNFPKAFFGIFWYNSSDYSKIDPVAYLKYTDNGRERYESNGYSIHLNGSFVINNVSLQHDRNFTAALLYSTNDDFLAYSINVIVTVKPNQPFPQIEDCNENERACFVRLDKNYELTCSVKDARPAVDLNWYIRSVANDRALHSEEIVTPVNTLYTSLVTTLYNVSNSNGTVVYVCKSINRPSLLTHEYSVILIQRLGQRYDNVEPETIYVQYLTSVELNCTNQPVLYLMWKKQSPSNHSVNLVDSMFLNNSYYTNSYSNNFYLTNQGRLRINEVDVEYEGVYICNFGDGISETIKILILQVYVLPDPPHLIIEGCSHQQYCVLFVPTKGEITCVVKGIRPQVKLQWEVVSDDQKNYIKFSNSDNKIVESGFKYDIYLTSNFHIHDSLTQRFAIRCKALNLDGIPFHLSTEIYLEPLQEEGVIPDYATKGLEGGEIFIYLILSLTIIAIIAIVIMVFKRRIEHTYSNVLEPEEELGSLINPRPAAEKINIFKQELRNKYQRTWKTLQPVAFIKEERYTVNEIFVSSDTQCLKKVVYGEDGKLPIWQNLQSHNFLDPLCQSTYRFVLEGEPGYGKSYLGYLLAYEWSDQISDSPMKDVDIYILLRLHYLKDISSIPKAIKKILLPRDSLLTDEDVATILYHSKSVVMYLDGFDRYFRDKDFRTTLMNDVYLNIINPKCCQFILTITPYCRPDEHYEVTKYLRLTGFSETNWTEYLKKSVWRNDLTECKTIVNILQENTFLGALCQVPLFFVLFAHISREDGTLRRIKVKTVTEFVRTVINCFHRKMDTVVDEHEAIMALCFDALSRGENFGLIWTKDDISGTLGKNVYKEYCNVGILIEKMFGGSDPSSCQRENNGSQHDTKVRFFHGIFCQWYAAQALVKVAKKSNNEDCMEYLQRINPCDHQYVYRFACGLDKEVTKRLISCFRDSKQENKFMILCIQEQTGNFDDVKDTIKQICSSSVSIDAYDTQFLQISTLELLKFAASENITIEKVVLLQKNSTFDSRAESLKLNTGLFLPKLSTLRCLTLRDPGRKVSKQDLEGLLKFASFCQRLKSIRFQDCLLPFLQPTNLRRERITLDEKEVHVKWKTPVHGCDWYSLDLKSGKWQRECLEGEIMSREQYAKMVQTFNALQMRTFSR